MASREEQSYYGFPHGRTYHDLFKRSARLANFFMSNESAPNEVGTVIGILTPNIPEAMETHFAVAGAARGVVLNLNNRLAPTEMAFILADAQPRWIVDSLRVSPPLFQNCTLTKRLCVGFW